MARECLQPLLIKLRPHDDNLADPKAVYVPVIFTWSLLPCAVTDQVKVHLYSLAWDLQSAVANSCCYLSFRHGTIRCQA